MAVLAAVCTKVPEAKLGIIFLPIITFTAGNVSVCVHVCVCTPGLGCATRVFGKKKVFLSCAHLWCKVMWIKHSLAIHWIKRMLLTFTCCVFAAGKRCKTVHERNGQSPVCVNECVSMHVWMYGRRIVAVCFSAIPTACNFRFLSLVYL